MKFKSKSKLFLKKHKSLTEEIGTEIEIYETKKIENMITKSDNFHTFYKNLRSLTKNSDLKSLIDENDISIYDNLKIVEKFKENFQMKFTIDNNLDNFIIEFDFVVGFPDFHINMNDLIIAIKQFNTKKSQGLTYIPNIVIKNCLNGVSKMLFCLYNKILDLKSLPQELKKSVVTPILKNNKNKNLFSSYRSVSVQSNIFRIFENILLNKMLNYIEINNIIPSCQYGYRKCTSISDLHIDMQKIIFESQNRSDVKAIDIMFLDFSDAFDTISHKRLFKKLEFYKFSNDFIVLLKECFKNRTQIVKYNKCFSKEINVVSGTLQGGVISPILFNLYIADIVKGINSHIFQFADDICLVKIIQDINDSNSLQIDLDKIFQFSNENSLKLNPEKCEYMRITRKNIEQNVYKINDKIVKTVLNHKHIGIFYDSQLSFSSHIDYIICKALKKYNTLRILCKRVNGKTFLKLYNVYIKPILEYSNLSIVLTDTQSERLEKVQRKISKFICFKLGFFNLNYCQRLEKLNLYSLKKRRNIQILKVVFKIRFNLFDKRNKWRYELIFYETTRNGIFCKRLKISKEIEKKNFFYNCVKLFNELPQSVRQITNYKK